MSHPWAHLDLQFLSHVPPALVRCLQQLPTDKVLCLLQDGNLDAHLHNGNSLRSTLTLHPTFPTLQHLVTDDLKATRPGHLHGTRCNLSLCMISSCSLKMPAHWGSLRGSRSTGRARKRQEGCETNGNSFRQRNTCLKKNFLTVTEQNLQSCAWNRVLQEAGVPRGRQHIAAP